MTGDVFEIEQRMQEQDPDLSMQFNSDNGNYRVYHKGQYVLEWPRPLDARLLTHMQTIDIRRGYDPFKEIDSHNEALERVLEKERLSKVEDAVKDKKRQLQRNLAKEIWQGRLKLIQKN